MNSRERDERQLAAVEEQVELTRRQVEATEAQARASETLSEALSAPERRRRKEEQDAAFPAPFRLLRGARGLRTLIGMVPACEHPNFPALFDREVPSNHLLSTRDRDGRDWTLVLCTCGEQSVLEPVALTECVCGRYFCATETAVRVHRFAPVEEAT
jgi:hypothetical protein